jgi:hypothetical protein
MALAIMHHNQALWQHCYWYVAHMICYLPASLVPQAGATSFDGGSMDNTQMHQEVFSNNTPAHGALAVKAVLPLYRCFSHWLVLDQLINSTGN